MTLAARRPAFLPVALRIGAALCRDAVWDGDACNWIGHVENDAVGAPAFRKVAALGPDVYGGTAGIALFLAELHRAAGHARIRDTALGAIRQALAEAEDGAGLAPLGLYEGRLGIAWAAVRVGAAVAEADVETRGLALARACLAELDGVHLLDLTSGSAGGLLACLSLARRPEGADFLAAARRLGDELVETAIRDGDAWSWDPVRVAGPGLGARMLTGLSHGAAGIGLALAELQARSGRPEHRRGAIGAFAYEDRWFDGERQNWRDLRELTRAAPDPFGMAWCHGAPGIGLARLRASALLPEKAADWRPLVEAAARAAVRWVEHQARDPTLDVTPCHGLAGVTELLSSVGGDHFVVVARAWRRAISAHDRAESWPSGLTTRARNPSLMIGTAGVGHALLRLHAPATESLLVPGG